MKKFQSLLCLLVAVLLLASCMGPKSLQRQINRKSYEPVLVFDSEIASEKGAETVSFDFVNESRLPMESTVTKNDGKFLWLLLYYHYNYDMTVHLGENLSDPTATNLVKTALYGTLDRSGAFNRIVETETVKPDYRSVITVKEIDVTCKYYRKGMGVWSYTTSEVKADKSIGKVSINLKLYDRNGKILMDKDYVENGVTDFTTSTTKYQDVRKMAMQNLIENLTVSSQTIGRKMTSDLNQVLKTTAALTTN